MCGVTGIFSINRLGEYRQALQKANDIIHYRGPDGAGFTLFDTHSSNQLINLPNQSLPPEGEMQKMTLAFGHRRLAIIDLSDSGQQPMSNREQSLWITYNGEIYNYLELRTELKATGYKFYSQSDTEVILAAYEVWGELCVSRFNGMWAFAIADLKQNKLFCSRDRFGIKPFYYYYDGTHFVFGSEIKQLLCFPFVPKRINERAVYEFLVYSAVEYGEETFFADIYKLLHGNNLTLDLADCSLKKSAYYQPNFTIDKQISITEASEKFQYLLQDSIKLRLRSDVEVGSCLSGGLDSSSIVCLMHELLKVEGKNNLQRTFSSHFEEKEANELEYMQEVIQATQVQAHFIYPKAEELLQDIERLVWHQEEPFGSTSIFAQWSVFKLVHQQGIKVMLDGQGADEQLAGYVGLASYLFSELRAKKQYFNLAWEACRHTQLQNKPWLSLIPSSAGKLLRRIFAFENTKPPSPSLDWIAPSLVERYQNHSHYQANFQQKPFGELEHLNNTLYQLTFHNNLQSLLKYEDRNSMAFSVESRVPFLDYRLVEFLFSLPSSFKIRHGYTKTVQRQGMKDVLPEKIRRRVSKLGFATPESRWQRTILRPLIEQALQDERLSSFIIPEQAKLYLEQIDKSGLVDFSAWRWVNLYLWMKIYEIQN